MSLDSALDHTGTNVESKFLSSYLCWSSVWLSILLKWFKTVVFSNATLKSQIFHVLLPSGSQRHSLRPYLDYIAYLYQRMDPLPEQERFEVQFWIGLWRLSFYCLLLTPVFSNGSSVTGIFYSLHCRWVFFASAPFY